MNQVSVEQDETSRAFRTTLELLEDATNLATAVTAVRSLVSMRDVVATPLLDEEPPLSLVSASGGQHALQRALENLEQPFPDELDLERALIMQLTQVVTNTPYSSSGEALQALQTLGSSIPRSVCQHPFRRNDIVWVCRTCQADETCVLCHNCFSQSQHEGHDVAFYHAQAGGCCDCGDPDAWDAAGFCPHHGPKREGQGGLAKDICQRVRGQVPATMQWLVNTIANNAIQAHERTSTRKKDSASLDQSQNESFNDDDDEFDDDDRMSFTSFLPSAASTSKSRHGETVTRKPGLEARALALGRLGSEGHGLYLALQLDEIHTTPQLVDALREFFGGSAYYTDTLLGKLVRALKISGQVVVWGTMELVGELGTAQLHCWLDGDQVASTNVGTALLGKASRLKRHGLICKIATHHEFQLEQRAVAVLQWLTQVARSCDPLCQTVAESILPEEHLVPMLRSDFHLSAHITKAWHSLLLTLLAVPTFKSHLAAAYCDTYRHVTSQYARGMGVLERSGYTLSVQFLNRVTYVVGLVQGRDLLGKLGKALLETLSVAAVSPTRLNPNHFCLAHRRYSPCISDLKCVLNVKGMARLFASRAGTFLQDWIESLRLAQCMDGQVWRTWTQGHVEVEPRGWVGAFNASISLGSLFERLLSWDDDDVSPIDASQSILAQNLQTCVELTSYVLIHGLAPWQAAEMAGYQEMMDLPSGPHRLCPASLPFSTVATRHGSNRALKALPIAQITSWSFHLPLHRFVAACLREVCRRAPSQGMDKLMEHLRSQLSYSERAGLFRGIMEFPLLVLSRAAQIRAGLWKRNGSGMHDQVLNYAEPPFCRALRDADILLLQFAMLTEEVGCCSLIHLLLYRMGLFEFMGFASAPQSDMAWYKEGNTTDTAQTEQGSANFPPQDEIVPTWTFATSTPWQTQGRATSIGWTTQDSIDSPSDDQTARKWTFAVATDVPSYLSLLEEFLHLLIILVSEPPPSPPKDKLDHTNQAKQRLKREVVHRLASGPKTHSELAEVHHVLSHWDNLFLSEEGKLLNPDDATGAALGKALSEVAERKSTRGRLAPDQWELCRSAWDDYDPAFFHISLRSHQSAAENRPKPATTTNSFGVEPKPYAPRLTTSVHPSFQRLRRDITADASVLSMTYRTLHVHCRVQNESDDSPRDMTKLRGVLAYEKVGMSETALARALHLLTLGALAWEDAEKHDATWRKRGGGAVGSVFYNAASGNPAPTAREWVSAALLTDPHLLMDCEWYNGEENALLLLRRLSMDIGKSGSFVAQDSAVKAGAAWLCEFAAKHNSVAAALIYTRSESNSKEVADNSGRSEMERKQKEARARAMEKMKAEAARFAAMMQIDADENDDDEQEAMETSQSPHAQSSETENHSQRPRAMSRGSTFGSEHSVTSAASRSPQSGDTSIPQYFSMYSSGGETAVDDTGDDIPDRLLKERPQCIICVDDGKVVPVDTESSMRSDEDEGNRKRSRRKTDGSNALAFVGYAQASTVLKGGGGPPPTSDDTSPMSSVRRFTGTHVALCGHAVHSECCESYLATVLHREDRAMGRREEFRCPLCQRLSNCLVPFIDVGVDWIDTPLCIPIIKGTSDDKPNTEPMDLDDQSELFIDDERISLHDFLSTTPWWVGRNDKSVTWDGQCAFIPVKPSTRNDKNASHNHDNLQDASLTRAQRKRHVRSLRKKDLYAAWNAMMRTPRFMRRRLHPKHHSTPNDETSTADDRRASTPQWSSEESSGETFVWRRFMDLLADMSYRADSKRLGEAQLYQNCGEFRHYHVERAAHNIANRTAGRESVDWPVCIASSTLPDARRQELSREKLLSKLMMSIQAFTYSSCCESFDVKRLLRNETAAHTQATGILSDSVKSLCSKYGISDVTCNGRLVLLPRPSAEGSEGSQPFDGRIGKLRYFALAVIAAAGAVSADLVQLVLSLPLDDNITDAGDGLHIEAPCRAPIVFPILLGHVLTHVVAAMCAACGRARARSDSLELAWPLPFSKRGSFYGALQENIADSDVDVVVKDCDGFIKLGLLARILQVLLRKMGIEAGASSDEQATVLLSTVRRIREMEQQPADATKSWFRACSLLLEKSLSKEFHAAELSRTEISGVDKIVIEQFQEACSSAAEAAVAFLADIGVIYQILVPGVVAKFDLSQIDGKKFSETGNAATDVVATFETMRECFGLEPIELMVRSSLTHDVLYNWFKAARCHTRLAYTDGPDDVLGSIVRSRLFQTEGFRLFDWPMESAKPFYKGDLDKKMSGSVSFASSASAEPHDDALASPLQVGSYSGSVGAARTELRRPSSGPVIAFSSRKCVSFLGGFVKECGSSKEQARPRVSMLPTSYTDLYAELGTLCPDCEQTALCLICGEVLNAGGKGECTKHSLKCGAGSCIFFLLQECIGLIMHGGRAAYVHSPYVDSHGETPQYRGRPLNLDLDRYSILHDLWSGHAIRQKVVAERGSSRQVIIADFY